MQDGIQFPTSRLQSHLVEIGSYWARYGRSDNPESLANSMRAMLANYVARGCSRARLAVRTAGLKLQFMALPEQFARTAVSWKTDRFWCAYSSVLSEILNHPGVPLRARFHDCQVFAIGRRNGPGLPAASCFPERLHATVQTNVQNGCGSRFRM